MLRLQNIEEQLNQFTFVFFVYLLTTITLIMQLTFFSQLKIQVSLLFLLALSSKEAYHRLGKLSSKKIRLTFPYAKCNMVLRTIDSILMVLIWILLITYIYDKDLVNIFSIISLGFIACIVNCFCVKYEETPCNATV